jgi:serine/threonine-protein kinase
MALIDVDLTGQTVDRYAIVSLIAQGGQGYVYRGRDERLERDVAIKVVRSGRSGGTATRADLITEARALSRLNHPHVAGIYDFVTEGGRDFIVMEFVPGLTLRELLASGPLPASEVARLGAQIARGLASAHAAHVVHRDIKPANLKITARGDLKILDFGVAKLLPSAAFVDRLIDTSSSGSIVGTVPYMAPERLRGELADERSDIFSTGVVLYEMATGRPGFAQRNLADLVEAIVRADPPAPSSVNPQVPQALNDVIVKAMQKERRARYRSARHLARALESLIPKRRSAVAFATGAASAGRASPLDPDTRSPRIAARQGNFNAVRN